MDAVPPIRWSPGVCRPSSLLLLRPSLFFFFSGEGSSPWEEGLGCCQGWDLNPRTPLGNRRAGTPAGIERGTWTVLLEASRGHCLRPQGSIRRALGVKYHFQSRSGQGRPWRKRGPGGTGRPPSHGGPYCGGTGPAYQWVPALGSPWTLGHRKPPLEEGRMGRAAGFDRTSAAPPQQPGLG